MKKDEQNTPEAIESESFFRKMMLDNLKSTSTIDSYELQLFDWYIRETEQLIAGMLSAEKTYIQEQIDAGAEDINDSGMVAAEYHLKRVRYSHLIYMVSLLESFLEISCENLAKIIDTKNTTAKSKGSKWSIRRKFIEEHGNFNLPEDVWSKISILILLRNNFVHDNGSTNELKKEEKAMLDKQPWVNLSGSKIVIEADYIHSASRAIKSLIQFVEARLGEIADRAISPKIVL